MESANNDARKWPILPFDVSRDFIISKLYRISRNFSLDIFLTYLKCLCKFRIDRNKSENTEV